MSAFNTTALRSLLLAGAAGLASAAMLAPAQQVQARSCLLDTNNDGTATAGVDTDGGADSGNSSARLACGPGAAVPAVLFGLPVVGTTSMAIDTFLVGDFQRAATLYDRWLPRVEISTEHDDFFTRNLVAILAEQRLALGVKNSVALTYGDFGHVS